MKSESQLVEECHRGDFNSFETIVDRFQKRVYNVAFRMVGDREEARDITQSVFLKAFQNLDSYDPKRKLFSWIYRIAVNESLNTLQQRRRLESGLDGDAQPSSEPDPELAAHQAEVSRSVQGALMQLKPEHRAVVILKHLLGFSYREIGQSLDLAEKTVKSRLFTARTLLRDALSGSGVH